MLSKLTNGPNTRQEGEEFHPILIGTPKRLETALNHRKQSIGARSDRHKNPTPSKSRSALPIFESVGHARATEARA